MRKRESFAFELILSYPCCIYIHTHHFQYSKSRVPWSFDFPLLKVWWWNGKCLDSSYVIHLQGRIQDFKLGGAHLKKLCRAEGARKLLGYFVWKITILRQKIILFPIAEEGAKIVGVFRVKKSRFYAKKSYFF